MFDVWHIWCVTGCVCGVLELLEAKIGCDCDRTENGKWKSTWNLILDELPLTLNLSLLYILQLEDVVTCSRYQFDSVHLDDQHH